MSAVQSGIRENETRSTGIFKLITGSEVAETLGIPLTTVYDHARSGLLPSIRIGRAVRFRPEAIKNFVERGGQPLPGGWRQESTGDK